MVADWMAVCLAPVSTLLIRTNPLQSQGRVIRLEERSRLAGLLNELLRGRIPELTESQLIAPCFFRC